MIWRILIICASILTLYTIKNIFLNVSSAVKGYFDGLPVEYIDSRGAYNDSILLLFGAILTAL